MKDFFAKKKNRLNQWLNFIFKNKNTSVSNKNLNVIFNMIWMKCLFFNKFYISIDYDKGVLFYNKNVQNWNLKTKKISNFSLIYYKI